MPSLSHFPSTSTFSYTLSQKPSLAAQTLCFTWRDTKTINQIKKVNLHTGRLGLTQEMEQKSKNTNVRIDGREKETDV
ncbi:hypothetical protein JD969_09185 [Planctomycetota bacterium]|nr:hypothetical protein JD969_09185 [Planctomycetota bacterium]